MATSGGYADGSLGVGSRVPVYSNSSEWSDILSEAKSGCDPEPYTASNSSKGSSKKVPRMDGRMTIVTFETKLEIITVDAFEVHSIDLSRCTISYLNRELFILGSNLQKCRHCNTCSRVGWLVSTSEKAGSVCRSELASIYCTWSSQYLSVRKLKCSQENCTIWELAVPILRLMRHDIERPSGVTRASPFAHHSIHFLSPRCLAREEVRIELYFLVLPPFRLHQPHSGKPEQLTPKESIRRCSSGELARTFRNCD